MSPEIEIWECSSQVECQGPVDEEALSDGPVEERGV